MLVVTAATAATAFVFYTPLSSQKGDSTIVHILIYTLTGFQNSFIGKFRSKFAIRLLLNVPTTP